MIRVVVAEDQAMVLGALAALLALEPDIEVVGRAADGPAAWALVQRERPDVLLSDIEMPGLSGLDLAARVQAAKLPTRVLIVTTFGRPGYLRRALDAGVRGYLLKDQPSEELAAAVRRVAAGQRVVASELAAAAWDLPDPLSERERSVLRLAEEGRSNKEIADTLGLSPGTVRNYLHEAAQKLGADNRVEAARIARARGWL
ncbi:DNA-binding response regulator [Rubrivivax sp. JA1026]|uniref:response regulator transcription factor n=1 Tax=Rubrivivax sp. JA1026 TaxID=2710888 RepID=UPI0013E903C9|nr:response regulator transcription factor [Rubrivivax sp. JA1026]